MYVKITTSLLLLAGFLYTAEGLRWCYVCKGSEACKAPVKKKCPIRSKLCFSRHDPAQKVDDMKSCVFVDDKLLFEYYPHQEAICTYILNYTSGHCDFCDTNFCNNQYMSGCDSPAVTLVTVVTLASTVLSF